VIAAARMRSLDERTLFEAAVEAREADERIRDCSAIAGHRRPPVARGSATSRAAAAGRHYRSVQRMIIDLLLEAGPVRDGGERGGMTAYELQRAVSFRRGRETALSSILGRIGGRKRRPELDEWVTKSGFTRVNRHSGLEVDVYVHRAHDRRATGEVSSNAL